MRLVSTQSLPVEGLTLTPVTTNLDAQDSRALIRFSCPPTTYSVAASASSKSAICGHISSASLPGGPGSPCEPDSPGVPSTPGRPVSPRTLSANTHTPPIVPTNPQATQNSARPVHRSHVLMTFTVEPTDDLERGNGSTGIRPYRSGKHGARGSDRNHHADGGPGQSRIVALHEPKTTRRDRSIANTSSAATTRGENIIKRAFNKLRGTLA